MGKRKSNHGKDTWANPGGHLEFGETIEACGRREVMEETGINLSSLSFLAMTNDIFAEEDKHYITIHMLAESLDDKAQVLEPKKVSEWQWFDAFQWPEPLFLSMENFLSENPMMLKTRKFIDIIST